MSTYEELYAHFSKLSNLFKSSPRENALKVLSYLEDIGFTEYVFQPRPSLLLTGYMCKKVTNDTIITMNLSKSFYPSVLLSLRWIHRGTNVRLFNILDEMGIQTQDEGWRYSLKRLISTMEEVADFQQKQSPTCPKCSSVMLKKQMKETRTVRDAKGYPKEIPHPHGGEWFYGCIDYPNCTGIKAYWVDEDDISVGNYSDKLECPLCGGSMVIRKAKHGKYAGTKFFGCSNYPECKKLFTREEAMALVLMQKSKES